MKRKYELTNETKIIGVGTTLHRIRAVRDFTLANGTEVRSGDLGGWIEKEDNLSHANKAWIYDEALVFDKARIFGDALVFGKAEVFGKALVLDEARIYDEAHISGSAWIGDKAIIYNKAAIHGTACIYDEAKVCDDAQVYGGAWVYARAWISGDAIVCDTHDYAVYKNTWSSGRYFTYTRSNRMWRVGCFHGTGEMLIAKAYKDSKLSGQCYETIVRAQETIDKAIERVKETK